MSGFLEKNSYRYFYFLYFSSLGSAENKLLLLLLLLFIACAYTYCGRITINWWVKVMIFFIFYFLILPYSGAHKYTIVICALVCVTRILYRKS